MEAQQGRIRLLSYNVQVGIPTKRFSHYITHSWKHLLPFPQRRDNLNRIAEFISDFDIVGLQELDAGSIRSEFIHQPEYIAEQAGFPYCYHRVNRDLGIVAQHSLAILSRCEAHCVVEHKLPSTIPGRGALEAHFGDPEDPLVVILAHLSLSARSRKRQLDYLGRLVNGYRHVVVMGDLNTEAHSEEIRGLLDSTDLSPPRVVAKTYPSWKPKVAYDHIFVTPEIKLGESEVYGVKHSDHLPVSIEVDVPESGFPKRCGEFRDKDVLN
ncbi:MAG TPA: EEP domain-containing protein [Gammaproteobacteria bacterium]|nr:EEP domain-containing protein [Gammaproteobacteria bacterium]